MKKLLIKDDLETTVYVRDDGDNPSPEAGHEMRARRMSQRQIEDTMVEKWFLAKGSVVNLPDKAAKELVDLGYAEEATQRSVEKFQKESEEAAQQPNRRGARSQGKK